MRARKMSVATSNSPISCPAMLIAGCSSSISPDHSQEPANPINCKTHPSRVNEFVQLLVLA